MSATTFRSSIRPLGLVAFLMGVFVVALWSLAIFAPLPYEAEQRAQCDRSVATLLSSKDLVEVTRAGIIIERLNCGVGRRLDQAATR